MRSPAPTSARFRRVVATLAAAVAVVALSTSGCASTFYASTSDPYTPADGTWTNTGTLELRNVVAVAEEDGAATLVATIFNTGDRPDQLDSISVSGGGRAEFVPVTVPASGSAVFGASTDEATAQRVTLVGQDLKIGDVVTLTFDFETAAPAELEVMVVRRAEWFEDVPEPKPLSTTTPID